MIQQEPGTITFTFDNVRAPLRTMSWYRRMNWKIKDEKGALIAVVKEGESCSSRAILAVAYIYGRLVGRQTRVIVGAIPCGRPVSAWQAPPSWFLLQPSTTCLFPLYSISRAPEVLSGVIYESDVYSTSPNASRKVHVYYWPLVPSTSVASCGEGISPPPPYSDTTQARHIHNISLKPPPEAHAPNEGTITR